ncbi:hypothetical protein SETIT_2G008600v2 [Setaria italica]|uniref:Dirigent protein n=2 Tax=Setaria TaxID=4554 RepID=K4A0Q2_SETIT|nr:dirigent protein 11-like [Setaria italica]XP_034583304.1 dirigent protein 11-like [Setaria viridis]RCV09206.1 hypothetical protein SETIT_2G008600v2 [Setaria italica]TKW30100.1 hypothetical protein SEVIR_2G012300v2 [Setaria viridis]
MTNPPYSKFGALRNPPQEKELFFHLYLHHAHSGADQNQFEILASKRPNILGTTLVNDWLIYDKRGQGAKVVARAQGLHIQSGMKAKNWRSSFSIVFEDANARFKGSSLEVMGPHIRFGQWAIVGGTGEFTLARGIIHKTEVERLRDKNIIELKIHAFYTPMRAEAVSAGQWTLGP